MGEHLLCTQGVRGSNPLISTNLEVRVVGLGSRGLTDRY